MFMRDAVELPCPDSAAGLYIRTRTDQIVKVYFLVLEIPVMQEATNDDKCSSLLVSNFFSAYYIYSRSCSFPLFEIIHVNIAGWDISSIDFPRRRNSGVHWLKFS
jgi:hypothetical protein